MASNNSNKKRKAVDTNTKAPMVIESKAVVDTTKTRAGDVGMENTTTDNTKKTKKSNEKKKKRKKLKIKQSMMDR